MTISLASALAILGMGVLASFGSYFLKLTAMGGLSPAKLLTCRFLYAGGFLYVASALLNYYLLKIYPFSLVVPLGALTYIWTQIISKVLLGEPSSVRKSVGIGLILVGVTVVAWSY